MAYRQQPQVAQQMIVPFFQLLAAKAPPLSVGSVVEVDAEQLMDRLEERLGMLMSFGWEDTARINLCTRDDASYLCEAYNELPIVAVPGGTQNIWLLDGGLVADATFTESTAHVELVRAPFLREEFLSRHAYSTPIERYVGAWARLVDHLSSVAYGTCRGV